MIDISKQDWKLFREKLPEWQEAYMEKLIKEYSKLLNSSEPASEKFWALEERIKKDKKNPGVILEVSKSEAIWDIATMIKKKVITTEDLSDFSSDLKDAVQEILKSVIREQKLPFEVKADPFFSKENESALKKSIKQLDSGKGKKHDIIEAND